MVNGTTAVATRGTAIGAVERAAIMGDLKDLSEGERLDYYKNVCASIGLNPLTQPFGYIVLNSKLVLYAKRDAAEQLRKLHNVSCEITGRQRTEDLYIVTARATMPDGRTDESTGVVSIAALKGEALANALMKAETKAKRRVTLSVCGLGYLDETEVEDIPQPHSASANTASRPAIAAPDPGSRPITSEQMQKILATGEDRGYDHDGLQTWVLTAFDGVQSMSDLTQAQAKRFYELVKAEPLAPATAAEAE